jgi:hypothetical protein
MSARKVLNGVLVVVMVWAAMLPLNGGAVVPVRAQGTSSAAAGSTFAGWSGDATGSVTPATAMMTGDKSITAASNLITSTLLTVAIVGNGLVTPTVGTHAYPYGAVVSLTATANTGSTFAGWSDDLSGNTTPTTITMTANKTVTATFTQTHSLLALYILQFDGYITSTVYLDVFYTETVQSLVTASVSHTEKTAVILADRSGTTSDAIYHIYDGVMTNVTSQWVSMTAEVDATDGQFLGQFVAWARGQYPASRTTLSLIGHGLYAPPEMGTKNNPHLLAGWSNPHLLAGWSNPHLLAGWSNPHLLAGWSNPHLLAGWSNPHLLAGTSLSPHSATPAAGLSPLPFHMGGSPDYSDVNPQPGIFSTYDASEMLRIGSSDGASPLEVVDFLQCFGASVEEFYPLRNYARMLTGSPNYAFYDPALPGNGLTALDPGQTPAQMATALINAYHTALPAAAHPHVLVAVDTTHLVDLKDRLDWLSATLLEGLSTSATRADYRLKITQAYSLSLHYDTTGCPEQDWDLCPPDAMVDVDAFAEQLQAQFPFSSTTSAVYQAADDVAGAAQSVVSVKLMQNGKPWFGTYDWNFAPGVGLSLYADFLGRLDEQGNTVLNGISNWYTTSTVSISNPHPYEFITTSAYSATWADVLHSFWATSTITTELCLPAFPNILETGEVAAVKVLFPPLKWTMQTAPVTPTVVFSTAYAIHNPTLDITVTQASGVVYTDTLYLGYRVTGMYAVAANHAWTPSVLGPFTLTFKVDSRNQISETNEADNTFTLNDSVQRPPPCPRPIVAAAIVGGQQWITTSQVALNIAQTGDVSCPVTQLTASFYGYTTGQNPTTQLPVHLGDRTIFLSLPQSGYQLALPAGTPAGIIVVYLWPSSDSGGYGYPVPVTFSYTPPATAIGSGAEHFYRFTVVAGEHAQVTCQTGQGSARLYVWEPGNPASALSILCTDSLPLASTQAGEYIVSVAGLAANTTYTLTATRGGVPLRANTSDPVEYVTRSRPTFIEPLPELPTLPNLKVYLPLLRR